MLLINETIESHVEEKCKEYGILNNYDFSEDMKDAIFLLINNSYSGEREDIFYISASENEISIIVNDCKISSIIIGTDTDVKLVIDDSEDGVSSTTAKYIYISELFDKILPCTNFKQILVQLFDDLSVYTPTHFVKEFKPNG